MPPRVCNPFAHNIFCIVVYDIERQLEGHRISRLRHLSPQTRLSLKNGGGGIGVGAERYDALWPTENSFLLFA